MFWLNWCNQLKFLHLGFIFPLNYNADEQTWSWFSILDSILSGFLGPCSHLAQSQNKEPQNILFLKKCKQACHVKRIVLCDYRNFAIIFSQPKMILLCRIELKSYKWKTVFLEHQQRTATAKNVITSTSHKCWVLTNT